MENPITYDSVEKKTLFLISLLSIATSFSMEYPVMNEKYAGIKGRIQGDKKESRPARNAAG